MPDYKNWVPKGMVAGLICATGSTLVLTLITAFGGGLKAGAWKWLLVGLLLLLLEVFTLSLIWSIQAYRAFSYHGKEGLSRQIIEGIAAYVQVPAGSKILDVGCGSGALTIACAKRNPESLVVGLDRWGKDYASFSKQLCEKNASAEGVHNIQFVRGDAIQLDFPNESFEAVTSNYVYHNITGKNKQELLLETLRVLKKGGVFAIHDLMSFARYGNMEDFLNELKAQGYEQVVLIDTTNGMFMTRAKARRLKLFGSAILYGVK